MKRDMDLIRRILLWLEDQPDVPRAAPTFDAVHENDVFYNCRLMAEAGFIEIIDTASMRGARYECIPERMTWRGHEFLDAARSETIWAKAKGRLSKVGETAGMETIMLLLRKLANVQLGLESE